MKAMDMTMTMKATTPTDDGDGTRHGTRNPATRGIVASYVAFVGVSRFVCVCVLWGGGSGSAAGPCSVRGKYLHNKKGDKRVVLSTCLLHEPVLLMTSKTR